MDELGRLVVKEFGGKFCSNYFQHNLEMNNGETLLPKEGFLKPHVNFSTILEKIKVVLKKELQEIDTSNKVLKFKLRLKQIQRKKGTGSILGCQKPWKKREIYFPTFVQRMHLEYGYNQQKVEEALYYLESKRIIGIKITEASRVKRIVNNKLY